jgi:hypothetical protein
MVANTTAETQTAKQAIAEAKIKVLMLPPHEKPTARVTPRPTPPTKPKPKAKAKATGV